jgi:hypothetical protein
MKALITNTFKVFMTIGFGFAVSIISGTVALMGFGHEYMLTGVGIGFVIGCIGGWLR